MTVDPEPQTLWQIFEEERQAERQNLPYNGHSGFVAGSDTSTERALDEDASGQTQSRLDRILEAIKLRPLGMTWNEVAKLLDLHHGQASGALSMLHKQGLIFALTKKRNKCHPYVAVQYRNQYPAMDRIDEPVRTKASMEREVREVLIDAVDALLKSQSWETINALREAREQYKDATER